MITIKTPEKYINEPNVLKAAGEFIKEYGNKALIIGGKTALSVVEEEFFESLKAERINFEVAQFSGYPTKANIDNYSKKAVEIGAEIVIGIGGGRVLDLVKAVGEQSEKTVITIPTIAATCAAWSALTVLYDDEGRHSGYIVLKNSPKLILIDTTITLKAPVRYIHAGIGDTIVKWYETAPHAHKSDEDLSLKISLNTAELILDILNKKAVKVSEAASQDKAIKEGKEVVDAIIILAGLVGSINGGNHRAAIAHSLHDSFTLIEDTHNSLHGEKVIFGLIVQFILENKSTKELNELIQFLNSLSLPVTLKQLGITEDVESKVTKVASGINIAEKGLDKLSFEVNTELLKQAILMADELGKHSLKNTLVFNS